MHVSGKNGTPAVWPGVSIYHNKQEIGEYNHQLHLKVSGIGEAVALAASGKIIVATDYFVCTMHIWST